MSYPIRATGGLVTRKNQLMVIAVLGASGKSQEKDKQRARNRRNYLDRRRAASGKWTK